MNAPKFSTGQVSPHFRAEALRIDGKKVMRERVIEVCNPYDGSLVGTVPMASVEDVRQAFAVARAYRSTLTRFERAAILNRAAALLRERVEEASDLITLESGLCKKDSLYEIGRVADVLGFAANETLRDDGQLFSCDLTPHGKKRRVMTQRSPFLGVICAITPFNHPMNQVAHKVAPSIATNNRMVLKPSEKVPLSAYYLADILYEAGLPPQMLQVVTGDPREIADELITHPSVDLVTFTGGVGIGKYIANKAGYKRVVLELGGNDPLIVMDDADLERATDLAVQGSYKNSGQRCTAVKRMLVHQAVAERFTELVVEKTRAWKYGDPMDRTVDMGFVLVKKSVLEASQGNSHSLALDLYDQYTYMQKTTQWRFTPPTHVVAAFRAALDQFLEEGGQPVRGARYRANYRTLVGGMAELGFRPFLSPEVQAPIIVTFHAPDDARYDFKTFYAKVRERGYILYPGKLTQVETFRVGCIGAIDANEMRNVVSAIGETLAEMGIEMKAPLGRAA